MPAVLTAKRIEGIRALLSRIEVPDGGLRGLYLVVQPSGSKSWAVRYVSPISGKRVKLTVGSYPAYSLAEARRAAANLLRSVSEGKDPAAERTREAEQLVTVSTALEEFISRHVKARNRPRTIQETVRVLRREVMPRVGTRLLGDISRRDVVKVLDEIVDRGAPQTANRTFAVLRKFFRWCVERGLLTTTPMAGLSPPAAKSSRDRVLGAPEIALVWEASAKLGWPFGPFVRLLLLTGQRRDEVAGARWDEFSLEGETPTWTIPKERTKNGREHVVPLSSAAVDILRTLPRLGPADGFVFTTAGRRAISGYSRAKARLDRIVADLAGSPLPPWRLHDLRRTAASGMAALGHAVHVVEKVLNHISGTYGGIVGIYQRHDYAVERRRALCEWAEHVTQLVAPDDFRSQTADVAGALEAV